MNTDSNSPAPPLVRTDRRRRPRPTRPRRDLPDATTADGWRIDDLAQRAGVAVDTIRYYQREGLLPSSDRVGRTVRYSQVHLDRLERIKALQARRFSLAAIRALLDHDGPVEHLLDGRGGEIYDHDALIEAAGVSLDLVRGLEKAGVLLSPEDHGRAGYDAEDLGMLEAFGDLAALGAPDEILVELADLFARGIRQLQADVAELLRRQRVRHVAARGTRSVRLNTRDQPGRVVHDMHVINNYVQHRTIQRIVMARLSIDSDATRRRATVVDEPAPVDEAD